MLKSHFRQFPWDLPPQAINLQHNLASRQEDGFNKLQLSLQFLALIELIMGSSVSVNIIGILCQ